MTGYKTIREPAEDRFVEKKSEFIGRVAPVASEEEALETIARVKKENREARHVVFAYVLRNGVTRCSDDGEPQGTGGVPALGVLQKEGLTDVCLTVTRYFGGILLGGGGLARAYSHAAALAAAAARPLHMVPCRVFGCEIEYPLYGKLNFMLPRYGVKTLDGDFGERVRLTLAVRQELAAALWEEISELTGGGAVLNVLETVFMDEDDVRGA